MHSFPSPSHPIWVLSSITAVQTWLTVMNAYWTMNRFPDEDSLTSWHALAFLNVIVKRVSGKTVVVCGTLVCLHLSSWRFLVVEPLNRWCNWYWRWETWLWDCQEIHVYFQIFTTRISLFNEYKISGLVLNKTLLLVSRETAFEEYATDICSWCRGRQRLRNMLLIFVCLQYLILTSEVIDYRGVSPSKQHYTWHTARFVTVRQTV